MPPKSIEGGIGALANGHYILGRVFNAIEDVILRHGDVERCCVVAHGTLKKGRHLYALILAKGGVIAGEKMMRDLRDRVEMEGEFEEWEIPTKWRPVRFLPEAKTRERVRSLVKSRASFNPLFYPGRQKPFRGEGDWENPKLSIALTDPLNVVQFEGALSQVKFTTMWGIPCVNFDLRHKVRYPGVKAKGGNSFKLFVARFNSRDPKVIKKIATVDRGAHIVARGRCVTLHAGGPKKGSLHTVIELVGDLDVRSDFKRTLLDDTDGVFERAL